MGVAEFTPAGRLTEAGEKAQLIGEALDALRLAVQLDERESLNSTSWVPWYDVTIPRVQDIKILVGAMEIELHRRRGEQIQFEGERRGRPPNKVTDSVTNSVAMNDVYRKRRERDRALAAQSEKVTAYIQQEAAAGRVPSVHGALRAVQTTKPTKKDRVAAQQARVRVAADRWVATIDAVADGARRTDAELAAAGCDHVEAFLQRVRLVPWLAMDRTAAGTTFTIDHDLRAICEARAPRPALGHQSIRAYLLALHAEIARRRKENHDEFRKRKWNSELILKREQTALLDWIEEQLMKVPT
jgi:hypothetical protein